LVLLPFPQEPETVHELEDGAVVRYLPQYIPFDVAREQAETLKADVPWANREVHLFGRAFKEPRLTAWMAPKGCRYLYSGLIQEPSPWHPWLAQLLPRIEQDTGHRMNSVLANWYRDGQDGVGWHADNEFCFRKNPPVVSLSLGTPRRFQIRHRRSKKTYEWLLGNGDLLVMEGNLQSTHVHQVPRTAKPVGPRLNFTFRPYLIAAARKHQLYTGPDET
jgi:alkylated DNA repair dioxygenase AlkB